MEEKRDGFIFYRSYYEAAKKLNLRDKVAFIMAVCAFALDGEEITLSGAADAVFTGIRPVLEKNVRNYNNGKKGGRPKGKKKPTDNPTETEGKPTDNPTETETEPYITYNIKHITQDIEHETTTEGGNPGFPSLLEVEKFCLSLDGGTTQAAAEFYARYSAQGWMANGQPIGNWRGLLTNFLRSGGGQGVATATSSGSQGTPSDIRRRSEWMRRMLEEEEDE